MTNKTCGMAWSGLHVTPLGGVSMCCDQPPLTTITDQKIAEVRRSDKWNEIRQSMLDGKEHPACKKCWILEKDGIVKSPRELNNRANPHLLKNGATAELDNDILFVIDYRQSNICNMKCLSCYSGLSSAIGAEEAREQNIKSNGVIEIVNSDLENYVMNNIPNIKSFYFAGGEPLMNPVHWNMLAELDRLSLYDRRIGYNTNLSKLDYKGKHVFDYWDKFQNWRVGVSIDAIGNRAEYVRYGTDWNNIDQNLIQMQKYYPTNYAVTSCVSAINVAGLIELMDDLDRRGVTEHKWSNFVYMPDYLHVSILPRYYREQLVTTMADRIDINSTSFKFFKNQLLNNEKATSKDKQDFKTYIQRKDNVRGTNIFDSCPEFKDIWDDIK